MQEEERGKTCTGIKVMKMKEAARRKKERKKKRIKTEKLVHEDEDGMDAWAAPVRQGRLLLPGAGRWDTGAGMPFPNPTLRHWQCCTQPCRWKAELWLR